MPFSPSSMQQKPSVPSCKCKLHAGPLFLSFCPLGEFGKMHTHPKRKGSDASKRNAFWDNGSLWSWEPWLIIYILGKILSAARDTSSQRLIRRGREARSGQICESLQCNRSVVWKATLGTWQPLIKFPLLRTGTGFTPNQMQIFDTINFKKSWEITISRS